jgi:hypothetical protein
MAMTYEESSALMKDVVFIGRIKVACLKYADYIVLEAPTTPAHSTRIKWAQNTMTAPDVSANLITPTVVMDPAVQDAGGAAIVDTALQSAVENTINKMI